MRPTVLPSKRQAKRAPGLHAYVAAKTPTLASPISHRAAPSQLWCFTIHHQNESTLQSLLPSHHPAIVTRQSRRYTIERYRTHLSTMCHSLSTQYRGTYCAKLLDSKEPTARNRFEMSLTVPAELSAPFGVISDREKVSWSSHFRQVLPQGLASCDLEPTTLPTSKLHYRRVIGHVLHNSAETLAGTMM